MLKAGRPAVGEAAPASLSKKPTTKGLGQREAQTRRAAGLAGWGALTEDQQHVPGARPVQAAEDQGQQQHPAGRPSAAHGGGSAPPRPAPPAVTRSLAPPPGGHARPGPAPG